MTRRIEIAEAGDGAVYVRADTGDAETDWAVVHSLAAWFEEHRPVGVFDTIPTYAAVLVEYDPLELDTEHVHDLIHRAVDAIDVAAFLARPVRTFRVPVVFGGDAGQDLDMVAEEQGWEPSRIVETLCATEFRIRCIAQAGTGMTDGPPFARPVSRLDAPRITTPPGGILLAGTQALLKASASPTGWREVGRTPLAVVDLGAESIIPYRPGDVLRFTAIDVGQAVAYVGRGLADAAD